MCLVVNATMAMTRTEREWIKSCAGRWFPGVHLAVLVTHLDTLHSEEDCNKVRNMIADVLQQNGFQTKVFGDGDEALKYLDTTLTELDVQKQRECRVTRNAVVCLQEEIHILSEDSVTNMSVIRHAAEQLRHQRNSLELAGRVVAESVLYNAITTMKDKTSKNIYAYGGKMVDNVRQQVEQMPADELEYLEVKIHSYMSGAWSYFISSLNNEVEQEMGSLYQTILDHIEHDAGEMFSELNEQDRIAIYAALGLDQKDYTQRSRMFIGGNFGSTVDRLRKETRNLMLLSVPLLFVNPILSVGNLAAAKLIGTFREYNQREEYRKQMMTQIESMCLNQARDFDQRIRAAFDGALYDGMENVKKAYGSLTAKLLESLSELEQRQASQTQLRAWLTIQADRVLPDLLQKSLDSC